MSDNKTVVDDKFENYYRRQRMKDESYWDMPLNLRVILCGYISINLFFFNFEGTTWIGTQSFDWDEVTSGFLKYNRVQFYAMA